MTKKPANLVFTLLPLIWIIIGLCLAIFDYLAVNENGVSALSIPTGVEGFPHLNNKEAYLNHALNFILAYLAIGGLFAISFIKGSSKLLVACYVILVLFTLVNVFGLTP